MSDATGASVVTWLMKTRAFAMERWRRRLAMVENLTPLFGGPYGITL